jgi:hypothetical protein
MVIEGSLGAVRAAGSLYEQHGTAPTMAWYHSRILFSISAANFDLLLAIA